MKKISEDECKDESVNTTCSICQKDGVLMQHYPISLDSIQCNDRAVDFDLNLHKDRLPSRQGAAGCGGWFHKKCLKGWHRHCRAKNVAYDPDDLGVSWSDTTCPLCRAKNTFVWSFASDYELSNCLFAEDYLSRYLRSDSCDVETVVVFLQKHGMSAAYMNHPERSGMIPLWVNRGREIGGLLDNAVIGDRYDVVKLLLLQGAYISGRQDLDKDESGSSRLRLPKGKDTLLMTAVKSFIMSECPDERIFKLILNQGCIFDDLKAPVHFPSQPDVLLFSIHCGFTGFVGDLMPYLGKKHEPKVLLQFALKAKANCMNMFSLIVVALQETISTSKFDEAILACSKAPLAKLNVLDTVYGLVPVSLRVQFMADYLCTRIKLYDLVGVRHLLYESNVMSNTLTMYTGNWVMMELPMTCSSLWRNTFCFENGIETQSEPMNSMTFALLLSDVTSGTHNKVGCGSSVSENICNKISRIREENLSENACSARLDNDFHHWNIIELGLLRLCIDNVYCADDICHQVLLQFVLCYQEAKAKRFLDTSAKREKWIDRVIKPVVAYKPDAINFEAPDDTNVLLHCSRTGLTELFAKVFHTMQPNYDVTDSKGRNCLHLAVFHEHIRLVEYLMDEYSSRFPDYVNRMDNSGKTPLMLCSYTKSQPWKQSKKRKANESQTYHKTKKNVKLRVLYIVDILLTSKEFYPALKDCLGKSALDHAFDTSNEEIVDKIRNRIIESTID